MEISVNTLYFTYNNTKIIDGITFKLEKGKFYGIIGPNGAGKTTLLKLMSKILKPAKGEIFIGEKNIAELSYAEIAKVVAHIQQNSSFQPFSVFEYVMLGRIPYLKRLRKEGPKDREIVENALKFTDTLKFKDKSITEISGGEKQRAVIAKALAQEPKILFADEPTSQLDIKYQIETLKIFKQLTKQGMMVVCALHDLNLAAMFCDTLMLMHNGKIFANGSPEKVLTEENIKNVYGIDVEINKAKFLYIVPKI
ncbi:ABC transporter, ATP-binding protein [groundwater metagenome]|uniref:ABC transporter, ATP-binding protein n=1 Tax=groundwater metagenome TaxID=717931 RepID=A0A098E8L1_9ZZZZ